MKLERQIKVLAKIEFGDAFLWLAASDMRSIGFRNEDASVTLTNRDYPNDYNALHRVIRGMDKELTHKLAGELGACWYYALHATEEELMEAIIKAHGLWEDGE